MANATPVSICSNALLLLGAQPINSLDENNDRARLASNLYPQIRDAALRSHPWNCATKRVVLAPEAIAPAFDWQSAFLLPDDWLKTLKVGQDGFTESYRSEGRKILADTTVLYLLYVFRNDVEATWDSMLVHAATLSMKAAMCYPITKSTSAAQLAAQELALYLRQCRSADGLDDPPETFGDFPMLRSRYGNAAGLGWKT